MAEGGLTPERVLAARRDHHRTRLPTRRVRVAVENRPNPAPSYAGAASPRTSATPEHLPHRPPVREERVRGVKPARRRPRAARRRRARRPVRQLGALRPSRRELPRPTTGRGQPHPGGDRRRAGDGRADKERIIARYQADYEKGKLDLYCTRTRELRAEVGAASEHITQLHLQLAETESAPCRPTRTAIGCTSCSPGASTPGLCPFARRCLPRWSLYSRSTTSTTSDPPPGWAARRREPGTTGAGVCLPFVWVECAQRCANRLRPLRRTVAGAGGAESSTAVPLRHRSRRPGSRRGAPGPAAPTVPSSTRPCSTPPTSCSPPAARPPPRRPPAATSSSPAPSPAPGAGARTWVPEARARPALRTATTPA